MKKKIIAGIILLLAVVSVSIAVLLRIDGPGGAAVVPAVKSGQVGVIFIEGVILSGRSSSGFLGAGSGSEEVATRLRAASKNPNLKAVVLRLNSPGGSAAAAQEISAEVKHLRNSGKKVVASLGDTAASGAFWIASSADQIVADPGTLTGSIGVIIQTQNMQPLFKKLGIDTETFKSGPHKDMGSPSRPVTSEEKEIFQGMVDDIYKQFITVVAEGRKMNVARVRTLADGRVFTGRQALELGLVDRLGNYYEAIQLAGEMAGIKGEPAVVELGPRNVWREILAGSFGRLQNEFLALPQLPVWLLLPGTVPEQR